MTEPFRPPMGYDAEHVPVAYNRQIAAYAETVLGEYRPELLRTAGAVDGLHFLEFFLGLRVELQEIYTGGRDRILGLTAFGDGMLVVLDRAGPEPELVPLRLTDGSVVLDPRPLNGDGNGGCARFTQLHEAGHWLLHGLHFRGKAGNGADRCACRSEEIFGPAAERRTRCPVMTASGELRRKKLSGRQLLEHQANVFASHVAMPDATFLPLAGERIRSLGYADGVLEHQSSPEFGDEDMEKLGRLLGELSEVYGVGRKTAEIRLREAGLVRSVEFLDLWEKRKHAGGNLHP